MVDVILHFRRTYREKVSLFRVIRLLFENYGYTVNTPEEQKYYVQVYQRAVAIMDQEWLDAGKTREELDQEK